MAADFNSAMIQRIINSTDWERGDVLVHLEMVYRELVASQLYGELSSQQDPSINCFAQVLQLLWEREDFKSFGWCRAPVMNNHTLVRPRFNIPRYPVATLLEMHLQFHPLP